MQGISGISVEPLLPADLTRLLLSSTRKYQGTSSEFCPCVVAPEVSGPDHCHGRLSERPAGGRDAKKKIPA